MKYGSADFNLLLVDNYNLLGAKPQTFSERTEAIQERTDGLGDAREALSPTGLLKLTITQGGAFFDDTQNGMHLAFSAMTTPVSRTLTYSFTGGKVVRKAVGVYRQTYDVVAQQGRLTRANVTYQVNGPITDEGALLQGAVAHTAQWSTVTEGHTIDLGAGGAPTGGVVTLQVVALTGIATVNGNFQHSDDNVTFTTVGAVDPMTAAGTYTKSFAGVIKRYVAMVFLFPETTGSVTLVVTFKKNS